MPHGACEWVDIDEPIRRDKARRIQDWDSKRLAVQTAHGSSTISPIHAYQTVTSTATEQIIRKDDLSPSQDIPRNPQSQPENDRDEKTKGNPTLTVRSKLSVTFQANYPHHPKRLFQKSCERTLGALPALCMVYRDFRKHNRQLKENDLFDQSMSFIDADMMRKGYNFKDASGAT